MQPFRLPRPVASRPPAAALLILLAAVAGGGCGGGGGRAPSERFVRQAEWLHAAALASTVTPDADLNAYVQEVGRRLEAAVPDVAPDKARGPSACPIEFHLVDVPILNVFTTGGSHVYVYRGLLDYCQTEEELAAAMAHAYAHALNLDVERTGMNPPAEAGTAGRPLREVAWDFVAYRFTLEQEVASDQLAFRLYARAGWDPAQFERLFARLSDPGQGGTTGVAPDRQPLANRGAAARGMTAGVPRQWRQLPVADRRTFDALRDAADKLRHVSPAAAEGDNEALLYLVAFPNCILSEDAPAQRQAQEMLRPTPPEVVEVEPN